MKLLVILFFIPLSFAHQPRVVDEGFATEKEPYIVEEPNISKAFYATLLGQPHFYKIDSDKTFPIYINVLTPGKKIKPPFSFELLDGNKKVLKSFNGKDHEWKIFYEKYGRHYYRMGPELGKNHKSTMDLPKGTYYIKIFSDSNKGNYVLAVGQKESFPITEIFKTFFTMPTINSRFFKEKEE